MKHKKTSCKYFLSADGCKFGDKCQNSHTSTDFPNNKLLDTTLSSENHLIEPDIPTYFICPISHEPMEYPYTTTQGNSYEYSEISRWLIDNNTDPKSGVILQSKSLTPNNILRSQIIEWFEIHKVHRKSVALVPPPTQDFFAIIDDTTKTDLHKILYYKGTKSVEKRNKKDISLPISFPDYNQSYLLKELGNVLQICCDGGEFIEAPENTIFLTDKGVVFFDPTEIRETKVVPTVDDTKSCKFRNGCKNGKCKNSHPFVCVLGVSCPSQLNGSIYCKFNHPNTESVIPLGDSYPLNTECTWALKHYQKVIIHRFDKETQVHKFLGEYSLDNHYCNCAVGAGKYFIISFWPYEEEAIRTIWDCLKIARALEKEFRTKEKKWKATIQQKDTEIATLKHEIIQLRTEVSDAIKRANQAENKARINEERLIRQQLLQAQRKEARETEARWRKEQFKQEQILRRQKFKQDRERNERFRMRDPIHIYQLSSGTGTEKTDWTLVVDYHKGAHDLKLDYNRKSELHSLEITENDNIFLFDLLFPDVQSIADLPINPERLCAGF